MFKKYLFIYVYISQILLYSDEITYNLVKNMYKSYSAIGDINDKSILESSQHQLEKYFDSTLSKLLINDINCSKKNNAICKLDFDPIYNSQDPEVSSIKIIDNQKSINVLLYEKQSKSTKITYFFDEKTKKIHNIEYENGINLLDIFK